MSKADYATIPMNMDSTNQNVGKKTSGSGLTVLSVAIFIMLSLGMIVFLYNQNQNLKEKLATYQKTSIPTQTVEPTASPLENLPVVSAPSAYSKVKSPLKITGTVPSGWMFEGVFPIKLLDSEKNIIAQTQGKETTPGSWQEKSSVEFTATLTLKAASGSGTIVLESDNPSGKTENTKVFEIPITF